MTDNTLQKTSFATVIRMVAVIASVYGMIRSNSNWMFLTYFTNLSNIFVDIVLVGFIVFEFRAIIQKKPIVHSNIAYRVKFLATISITLTFLVYMLILAPNASGGVLHAYLSNGAGSLCVHFINPVLAILDFFLFDYEFQATKLDGLYGVIPPLVYVAFVFTLSFFGMRWGTMYAPYNFLNYGAKVGWFGFDLSTMGWESFGVGVVYMIVILVLIFIGLGYLFLFIQGLRKKKKRS